MQTREVSGSKRVACGCIEKVKNTVTQDEIHTWFLTKICCVILNLQPFMTIKGFNVSISQNCRTRSERNNIKLAVSFDTYLINIWNKINREMGNRHSDTWFPTRRRLLISREKYYPFSFRGTSIVLCCNVIKRREAPPKIPISSELHTLMAFKSFLSVVVMTD
jgi:hypothetical protein